MVLPLAAPVPVVPPAKGALKKQLLAFGQQSKKLKKTENTVLALVPQRWPSAVASLLSCVTEGCVKRRWRSHCDFPCKVASAKLKIKVSKKLKGQGALGLSCEGGGTPPLKHNRAKWRQSM